MDIPEDKDLMKDLTKEYWMCTTKFGNDRILIKNAAGDYTALDGSVTYRNSIVHPVCRVYPEVLVNRLTMALKSESEKLCKLENRWLAGELVEVPQGSMMNPEAYVNETLADIYDPMFPERYGEEREA